MVVSVALWSLELKPEEPEAFIVPEDLRITNVALGTEVIEEKGRTSVKLTYRAPKVADSEDEEDEDEEEDAPSTTVLCSLTPGKIEHALVDLILEGGQNVLFEAVGKNTVYLTGNFVDQTPIGHDHDDEDDYSDMEDPYGLEGASSDFDIDEMSEEEDDDSHRFEEVVEEEEEVIAKVESKKRPRESDDMEVDESKPSKAQKKKLNKKLKAENGEAVLAGTADKAEEKQKEQKKEQKEQKKDKKEKPKKDAATEEKRKKVEVKELAGGIKVEDHKVGTGAQAKNGDMVSMRYVGKLTSGKQFDANTKGKPFKFRLGKGEVIKGWDIGIAGMQVGGERKLTIPAPMGYGKRGQGPIPPNATLVFEVKLLAIN